MKFIFKAKTKEGELREGGIDAANREGAIDVLQKNNLFPISLQEEKTNPSLEKVLLKYYDRVGSKELVVFFRQLSILIESKVPIVASLSAIKEQTVNQYLRKIIKEVINDIQDGMPLSDAFAKHRDVFSNLAISIIKAGEASGNLKRSVEYVADNIEKNYNLVSKVRSAMMYPAIILVVFFIIGFLVMSFIVPKLTIMIKELNVEVPWYTKAVIGVSDFMSHYWWAAGIIILGAVAGVIYYIKSEEGKKEWDQIKIKLPVVGVVFRNIYIARFSENLSVLLVGGIPIIRALNIVSSVINNFVYESIFLKAAEEVKSGGDMSDVLKRYPQIPPIVSQMIKIGEESGQIDSVLKHVAKFYEQETDNLTKNLATLIEPILMIFIGAAVGFLAFAILMPIYNIAGGIQ